MKMSTRRNCTCARGSLPIKTVLGSEDVSPEQAKGSDCSPDLLQTPGFGPPKHADFNGCSWDKLLVQAREGLLAKDAFDKATWAFLGWVLGRNYLSVISMSKVRKWGYTGKFMFLSM